MRTELLLGSDAMERLHNAHVMICGVGAVGGFAAEMIARAGVGTITLVDFDRVESTNINRQLVAMQSTIGELKTQIMAARIRDINPECHVNLIEEKITADNVIPLLGGVARSAGEGLIVIDAIDDAVAKTALIATAIDMSVKIISSMGAGMRTDLASIKVSTIAKTVQCPLARRIRKNLKKISACTNVICVYSDAPIPDSVHDARDMATRDAGARTLPSMSTMTASVGIRVADETIKQIVL